MLYLKHLLIWSEYGDHEQRNLWDVLTQLEIFRQASQSMDKLAQPPGSAPTYEELRKSLDELHIVCECSREPIFTWYTTDVFATEARRNAIDVLMRCHRAQNDGIFP